MFFDGIWLKRTWAGEVKNVAVLVAVGVGTEGTGPSSACRKGPRKTRRAGGTSCGNSGVRLVVSDKCLGLVEALAEFYPEAAWQRCVVHFYRNVFTVVPRGRGKEVAAMLKAIHAQEDRAAAEAKAQAVAAKLEGMKLPQAAGIVREGVSETLSYMAFPREHWRSLRTNNMLERIMREIRRRTRVVGAFPDGKSGLMLVAARLRHVAGTKWGSRRYLDMDRMREVEVNASAAV